MSSDVESSRPWLTQPCVRILAQRLQDQQPLFSSGFLVSPDRIATCAHGLNYENRTANFSRLEVEFFEIREHRHQHRQQITQILLDSTTDIALIQFTPPLNHVTPLRLRLRNLTVALGKSRWESYAFPGIDVKGNPIYLEGHIEHSALLRTHALEQASAHASAGAALDRRIQHIQLRARAIEAGAGAIVAGCSGAPVVVEGEVVGYIGRILPNPDQTQAPRSEMGITYAHPIEYLHELLAGHDIRLGPPNTARRYAPPRDPTAITEYYVRRPRKENEALTNLRRCTPTLVWGARGIGKSTFIEFVRRSLATSGPLSSAKIVELDCSHCASTKEVLEPEQSLRKFLAWMLRTILTEIDARDTADQVHPLSLPDEDPVYYLTRQVASLMRGACASGLLLIITNAEHLFQWHHRQLPDQVWSLIKAWGNRRTEPWNRLGILVEVSSAPLLCQGSERLPANPTVPISIEDFTPEQVLELARHYDLSIGSGSTDRTGVAAVGNPPSQGQSLLGRLMELVGGHPELLQIAFHEAASSERPLNSILDEVVANPERSIYKDVLQQIDWQLAQDPQIRAVINSILRGRKEFSDRERVRLEIASIIELRQMQWCIRYGLYERYLRQRTQ